MTREIVVKSVLNKTKKRDSLFLKQALGAGFNSGVNHMPLLPYITDTTEHLEQMYSVFHDVQVYYIFPASLTLFGNGTAGSKSLMLRAVQKYYPDLADRYEKLFSFGFQPPPGIATPFIKKTNDLIQAHGLKTSILETVR